jgi:ribonuclease D
VPLSQEQQARLERLKAAREHAATRLGLSSGLLVNNQTLEKLSRLSAQEAAQPVQSSLKRWQVQAVGDDLLRAL